MAEAIKCGRQSCGKDITNKTEVEYSEEVSEFYCDVNCAIDDFFDQMRCVPFQFESEEMSEKQVVLKRGKLYRSDII
ncbi:hypothetical protein D3C78_1482740 [compost metagenome]